MCSKRCSFSLMSAVSNSLLPFCWHDISWWWLGKVGIWVVLIDIFEITECKTWKMRAMNGGFRRPVLVVVIWADIRIIRWFETSKLKKNEWNKFSVITDFRVGVGSHRDPRLPPRHTRLDSCWGINIEAESEKSIRCQMVCVWIDVALPSSQETPCPKSHSARASDRGRSPCTTGPVRAVPLKPK